jgi:hypothetical protein
MCRALEAHGVAATNLLSLGPNTTTPSGSQVVVATATVRNQFGSRLTSVYAPAVIASFGSGGSRIDVRVIAPNGATAYLSQLRADQRDRKANSNGLLRSPLIAASLTAQRQLAAGQVDSRLMFLLSFLAPERLDVVAFGDSGPGASAGMPLRSVTLTGGMASLRALVADARTGETALYVPTHTQIMKRDGRYQLVIEFSAPSPLLLFENPTP